MLYSLEPIKNVVDEEQATYLELIELILYAKTEVPKYATH